MNEKKKSEIRIRAFSEGDYPAIVSIHNSLNIAWPERPRTPAGWIQADQNRDPKCKFQRWVATIDGRVIGFGTYAQSSYHYPPYKFHINIEVSPSYQRQGVGSALYDQIMREIHGVGPTILRADAFTNLPQGFRFLQKRGFYEAFRETPVQLEIATFDPSPYTALEANLAAKGITVRTLREMEIDPERDRKLYELYWTLSEDVPHEDAEIEKPEFDAWVQWGVYDPVILPDGYMVAIHEDKYVGLRELGTDPDSDVIMGGLFGVRREYRRLGIGLAMQVRGIAYAREKGYPKLKSSTAAHNKPMQALFSKLGYEKGPEWIQCQRDL